MDSIDLPALAQQARRRYERARFKWSVAGALPVLSLVGVAVWLNRHPASAVAFGALAFAFGVVVLWRGQDWGRAFLPGVVSGVVPLVLSLVANVSHGCAGGHCSSWCVPACATGGLVAGAAVSMMAVRRKYGQEFWLGASALSLLTGAMGCACVGYSGLVALVLGYVVSGAVTRGLASA